MMTLIKSFALLLCLCGAYVSGRDLARSTKVCAKGQAYWCQNITNAVECRAMKHCIMSVWEKEIPIEKDDSSVCQTCLEMVTEARAQLESNMTQEEIKEVLEGSCRLIPVPPVAKECVKLMDDFAPQLIDTLASQMDPQVVCSVAGLCYNERVHRLEAEYMMKLEREELSCDDGAQYWCKNISTAAECGELKYCINYVWEKESRDSRDQSLVCESCVTAFARTRLLIDRTAIPEDEVAMMLESACARIPTRQECFRFMKKYMPELMQVVSSKTESQYACVVSGFCENPRLQAIENDYLMKRARAAELNCPNCNAVVSEIQVKFQEMSERDFLNILMNMCSEAGSFSDGCYAMIMREHTSVLEWLRNKLAPRPVCNLVSICRKPMTKPGQPHVSHEVPKYEVKLKGDLPCDLCIQLVQHLRDILVSNTTQEDFKMVLHGICGQMDQFKDECNRLVDEYYTFAYEFLINSLNGQVLCKEINICPPSTSMKQNTLVRPLMIGSDQTTVKPAGVQQLPIERMDPISPLTRVPSTFVASTGGPGLCSMCEYFLHFVQQEITLPSTENQIRDLISKECSKLPVTVQDQCNAFVDTYMDTLVALLAEEIDPSVICPKLGVCPGSLISVPYNDKPACPLCLLAMQEIYSKLNSTQVMRTSNSIGDIVDNLCMRDEFPQSVTVECALFISKYRDSVINMILTEFSPQESCAFIDICLPVEAHRESAPTVGNIKTNEIEDYTDSNACVLCEFVMTKLEDILKDRTTEEEIKEAVYKVCNYMPNSVKPKCEKFISQYADLIIQLLASEINPKEVCIAIHICTDSVSIMKAPMEKCLLCEALMDGLRAVLTDPDVDDNINHQLAQACGFIPQRERDLCLDMVQQLAPQIELAMRTLPVGPIICERINMCRRDRDTPSPGVGNCLLGSSYWCQSTISAAQCNAIEYCQQNVWMGNKPAKSSHKLGRIVIDY